jgi:hypothetical protein
VAVLTRANDASMAIVAAGGEPFDATAQTRACTQAQLRRFIKSRPYIPMHELRRRFELNGEADEVHPIRTSNGQVFVGLPARESGFIAELVRQGEIGLELSQDPTTPVVVGVFAMRPIPRS